MLFVTQDYIFNKCTFFREDWLCFATGEEYFASLSIPLLYLFLRFLCCSCSLHFAFGSYFPLIIDLSTTKKHKKIKTKLEKLNVALCILLCRIILCCVFEPFKTELAWNMLLSMWHEWAQSISLCPIFYLPYWNFYRNFFKAGTHIFIGWIWWNDGKWCFY